MVPPIRSDANIDDLAAATIMKYDVVMFYGPGGDFADAAQELQLLGTLICSVGFMGWAERRMEGVQR